MAAMTVPLVSRGNGRWGSPSPAWDHLINRESSGDFTVIQKIIDVNSGGNEAEGGFQITPATWRANGGLEFAQSPRLATPQQQAIVAARIFTRNPSGSDWGAGRPGRESASDLAAGLVPLDPNQPGQETTVGVSGDPTWLEDVLRPALGDRLKTLPGWESDGVGGTMGNIWGVVWHHTGNANATAESISVGRPDLAGPLSQLHIAPDGTVTIVAVGPCNHAGAGSWPGLPTDNINDLTIGIECAWPRNTNLTEETASQERWPDAQIIAMRDTGAALTKHLGVDVSHNISHREWARFGPAGQRQYKWDPGNLNMDWFRGEIQKAMDGQFGPQPIPTPTPTLSDHQLLQEIWDQLRGPGGNGWPQLGGKSLVDAVADLLKGAK